VYYVQRAWKDVDLHQLAILTKSVYEYEGRGEYSIEQFENNLKIMNERFPLEIVIIALCDDTLVGWIGIERKTKNIGEISRWHPLVADVPERDEIAKSLITEVMSYARENEMNRLEISFGSISDAVLKPYKKRQSWLKALNWNLVEDTFFMSTESSRDIPEVGVPNDFSIEPLLENENDALYSCHYVAFTTSEAREFYGLTEDERRQHFDKLYDRNQPINSEASFVIKKNNEVVSILLVISRDDEEYISVVAVHPNYRGQGLAKALLTSGIKKIRQQGTTNISIGVDVVNTPAVQLYSNYGFEVKSRLSFFSWNRTD